MNYKNPVIVLILLLSVLPALADEQMVRIGVLSHRGFEATLKSWSPTAEYLSRNVPGYRFKIVPLGFDEVDPSVRYGQIDFLLVNSGIYVNMEVRYRVSRIATLDNMVGSAPYNVFGGVVFVRRDRRDINSLENIRGHRMMAVDETSLGGFQMAWREMQRVGIDPHRHLQELSFSGTHDRVVMAVRNGEVEVGTVRTNILERMAGAGEIDLDEFRIIGPKVGSEFPFVRSTALYPEWPFSKLQHTPNMLAQQVAVALLSMPRFGSAAIAGKYAGWTVPLDYQPVHELFRELKLPPYENLGKFTLADAIAKYWYWLLLALGFLLIMFAMTTWVARLNRELTRSRLHLKQQHDLILNSVADGISGVDLEGNTTFVNRAMTEITGWKSHEMIGRNQHRMLHHSHADGSPHPPEECPVYRTFNDNVPRFIGDDVFWKKNGQAIPVEYSSTPIRNEKGRAVGSVVVFRDISVRKQAEEDARQHLMDLAHVARLSTMGEMASGIAHELNQPLTAIATNSHACIRMLESGKAGMERCADVMERIGAQAERAGEIIRHLRKFVSKEQPELTTVDLNELVDEVLIMIRPEAGRAGVRILTELDHSIPAVRAQRIQIDQVLVNLLRNAIEAMSDTVAKTREVRIATALQAPGLVCVTVSDTGPGLSVDMKSRLFTPFATTKSQGMGLGLSISLGIIEAHGGNLHLDSKPEEGAVFRFTLPVDPEDNSR